MEIKFTKGSVKEILSTVCHIANSKIGSAYSCVKLSKKDDELKIYATDGVTISIFTVKLIGNNADEGEMIMSARELSALVDGAPEENMTIKDWDNKVQFESGSFKARLAKLSGEIFPSFDIKVNGDTKIDFLSFKRIIEQALIFVDVKNQGVLQGVAFCEGYVVGASGPAVTLIKDDRIKFSPAVIMPLHILNIISNIQTDATMIEIDTKDGKILFKLGTILLGSQMIDGKYPDIISAMGRWSSNLSLVVNKNEILGMIKRARLLMRGGKDGAMLIVSKNGGATTYCIKFADAEGKETAESYLYISWDGEEFEGKFNLSLLNDAVSLVRGTEVHIKLGVKNEAGALQPLIIEEGGFKSVLMGMRI